MSDEPLVTPLACRAEDCVHATSCLYSGRVIECEPIDVLGPDLRFLAKGPCEPDCTGRLCVELFCHSYTRTEEPEKQGNEFVEVGRKRSNE